MKTDLVCIIPSPEFQSRSRNHNFAVFASLPNDTVWARRGASTTTDVQARATKPQNDNTQTPCCTSLSATCILNTHNSCTAVYLSGQCTAFVQRFSNFTSKPQTHLPGLVLPPQNPRTSFKPLPVDSLLRHPSDPCSFCSFLRPFVGHLVMFSKNVLGNITRSFRHRHLLRALPLPKLRWNPSHHLSVFPSFARFHRRLARSSNRWKGRVFSQTISQFHRHQFPRGFVPPIPFFLSSASAPLRPLP